MLKNEIPLVEISLTIDDANNTDTLGFYLDGWVHYTQKDINWDKYPNIFLKTNYPDWYAYMVGISRKFPQIHSLLSTSGNLSNTFALYLSSVAAKSSLPTSSSKIM
jgi:hypothetical protein